MSKPKLTAQWFVEESLRYERAVSMLNVIARDLRQKRSEDKASANKAGVKPDGSFDLVIERIESERQTIQETADLLWKEAEKRCTVPDYSIEDLLNAVLTKATSDYEALLSGMMPESRAGEIEYFFKHDADGLTSAEVSTFIPRIKRGHEKFVELVRLKKYDIIEETNRKRKSGGNMQFNSVKCPLCGSGLYEYGTGVGGRHLIRCTGCNLSEMVFL